MMYQVLQTVCKTCARVLLRPEDAIKLGNQLSSPQLTHQDKELLGKMVREKAKQVKVCGHCKSRNGVVKKGSVFLTISHKPLEGKAAVTEKLAEYSEVVEENNQLAGMLASALEHVLSPLEVLSLFERIPQSDLQYLMLTNSRPESMILTRLTCLPLSARPSLVMEKGSREDDITTKLADICKVQDVIREHKAKGAGVDVLQKDWTFLQYQVSLLYNGEPTGVPLDIVSRQPMRGLEQRLKGKAGRFRGNLSGKRVNFSSRTVISPDPNLTIDQVSSL